MPGRVIECSGLAREHLGNPRVASAVLHHRFANEGPNVDERKCRNVCVFQLLMFAALIVPGFGFGTPSAPTDASTPSVSTSGPRFRNRVSPSEMVLAPNSVHPSAVADPASFHGANPASGSDLVICSSRPPHYPPESIRRGEQGTVQLRVRIAADGIPINASIATSSGFVRLDEAARKVVLQWTFEPALRNGIAVEQETVVPVTFSLDASSPHRDDQDASASGSDAGRRPTEPGP